MSTLSLGKAAQPPSRSAVARTPQAGLDTGTWTVPIWHAGMSAFATCWMAPYATRFDDTRGSRLALDPWAGLSAVLLPIRDGAGRSV